MHLIATRKQGAPAPFLARFTAFEPQGMARAPADAAVLRLRRAGLPACGSFSWRKRTDWCESLEIWHCLSLPGGAVNRNLRYSVFLNSKKKARKCGLFAYEEEITSLRQQLAWLQRLALQLAWLQRLAWLRQLALQLAWLRLLAWLQQLALQLAWLRLLAWQHA